MFQDIQSMDMRILLEGFTAKLNTAPKQEELQKTPDGKAFHFPISFVEMTLDEMFFGLWSTENFRWSAIQNEVQGAIDLIVLHPTAGFPIRRTGTASIQIMVDSVPDELKNDRQAKNNWSTDVSNKKPNALYQGFPKLKSECIKNAALSLGKAFGRDINRKIADNHKPLISGSIEGMTRAINAAIESGKYDSAKMLLGSARTMPLEMKNELLQRIPA